MGAGPPRPSLARWSLFAVTWHFSVWVGWAFVAAAAIKVQPAMGSMPWAFWVIAGLVLLGEFRPVKTGGWFDQNGTVTTTAFVLAIMYLWGPWPALLLQAGATTVSQRSQKKPSWTLFFNVGQYCVSLMAAWVPMYLAGEGDGLVAAGRTMQGQDLSWIAAGWVAWFVANNALVSGLAADQGQTFREAFFDDFWFYVVSTAAVLALSPIVVLVAQGSLYFIPLLLIPMFAVHQTGRISMVAEQQSLHDALTGLPNRKYLLRRLDEAVSSPQREPFALCLLDLDRFKEVNDTLGHHVGDQLLVLVSQRLSAVLRPDDLVARLGGDEFALLLPGVTNSKAAAEVAHRVRHSMEEPFNLEGVLLELEASFGITVWPEHGDAVEQLMRRADVAMYVAKESHGDVEVYDPSRDHNTTDRLGLLAALRRAIDAHELEVHYQPKVSVGARDVVGVEALVRWNHPERGYIPPDEFIPLAETSGLMHRLTEFVIDAALGQVAEWRRMGLPVSVAVNVSARDLHGAELLRTVSEGLARHRVPASFLCLELTERTLMTEHTRVMDTLEALEALDVTLSLDDFGTGYSSMFMLQRLPVSEIKVDRSFVSRLADGGDDASIVRSIIELAHGLGLDAVAEGVETEQVWQQLVALGCDNAQGWLISRPMSGDLATAWLQGQMDVAPAALRAV
ncbi:MAG TPA: EAL domain-containing protein [Actinomycetes bacterium]